jgi:hypothetical protein
LGLRNRQGDLAHAQPGHGSIELMIALERWRAVPIWNYSIPCILTIVIAFVPYLRTAALLLLSSWAEFTMCSIWLAPKSQRVAWRNVELALHCGIFITALVAAVVRLLS